MNSLNIIKSKLPGKVFRSSMKTHIPKGTSSESENLVLAIMRAGGKRNITTTTTNTSTSPLQNSNLMKSYSNTRTFSVFSPSIPNMEVHTIKVPTMGDSITEGTIVEWTAEVGQMVKEDDVVALVETDKVTVEIKAETDGVLVARFGDVDDTIEVGADLYQLDTDKEATVETTSQPPSPTSDANTMEVEEKIATVESSASKRIPSIHFLGKDGWEKRRTKESQALVAPEGGSVSLGPIVLEMPSIDPMYGRPPITEAEMEALMMGGAE